MGLWYHRQIKTQRKKKDERYKLPSSFLDKKYTFDNFSELAFTSEFYTSQKFYKSILYERDDIYIAIDGDIKDLGNSNTWGDKIIDLYQAYGKDSMYRIKGKFSLILYDQKRELSLLFRSFFSENPLYFVEKNNILSVSTNPIYLLRRPDISDDLDSIEMTSLFTFTFKELKGNVFSHLSKVESGEIILISSGNIQHIIKPIDEYFISHHYGSEIEVIDRYRSMLESTVKESLLVDAEYGIMLSSGMDSSSIAVFAKQFLDKNNQNLKAYSWSLPNESLGDESHRIKDLANTLNIPLTLFDGERFGPFDILEYQTLVPDTPYMNPFNSLVVETYKKAANDGIDILLNGGYGDLLYLGRENLLIDILRDKQFRLFFPEVYSIIKNMGLYNSLKHSPPIRNLFKNILPKSLIKHLRKPISYHIPEWLSSNVQEQQRYILEQKLLNLQENKYTDRNLALFLNMGGKSRYLSSNYGILTIDPYHNIELLNYTSGIPSYMTYRKGNTKYYAREAMKNLLPESIRVQSRVGVLSNLLSHSYERNRKKVREMLLDERSFWSDYISELWMEKKLSEGVSLNPNELAIFRLCIDLQVWQKAIKPGGSLYEADLVHTVHNKGLKQ